MDSGKTPIPRVFALLFNAGQDNPDIEAFIV
jgi:hypothetical protein